MRQTVVRTRFPQGTYIHETASYEKLKELLSQGFQVKMCNPIGNELEYILEIEQSGNKENINERR